MELDEMKTMWEAYDRKLDTSIRLSKQLLKAPALRKAQSAMTRMLLGGSIGLLLLFLVAAWLGNFNWTHLAQLRFLLPGLLLQIGAIALIGVYIRRIVAIRAIDFAGPIVGIQKQIEAIRIAGIRSTKWTILVAPLAWTPFQIVTYEGLFGVDVYAHFSHAWLAGNVIFGLVVLGLEQWIAHRYAERMHGSARLQRWMRDLSGYNLNAATSFLQRAAEFEDEARV